jgi:hypothetical protein
LSSLVLKMKDRSEKADVWEWHRGFTALGLSDQKRGSRYSDWLRTRRHKGRSSSLRRIIFFLFTSSRPALGPMHPPFQWAEELFPRRYSGRNVKLTTPPQLTRTSRISEYILVPKIRERIAVNKQGSHKFYVKRYSLKKLN